MKFSKIFCMTVLLAPLALLSGTLKSRTYNFRKARWGMTRKEVRISEGRRRPVAKPTEEQICYVDTIDSKTFLVAYSFVDNKLVSGGYVSMEEHTNDNKYIEDYEEVKELLVEKYGKPRDKLPNGEDYNEMVWSDDLYENDPDKWGFAVSMGDLAYQSYWETSETYIALKLNGDNSEVSLCIIYRSKKLANLLKKAKEKEIKNKF